MKFDNVKYYPYLCIMKIDINSIVLNDKNINFMKSSMIRIYDIEWNLENCCYDEMPTEFTVDMQDFDGEPFDFAADYLDYTGSKVGATPLSFDFELV